MADKNSNLGRFALAPASAPTDLYAAGYDGNRFDSRAEAEQAIPNLRACGAEFDVDWIVVERFKREANESREKHWEIDEMSFSKQTGGLHQIGFNHFSGEAIYWDVNPFYGWNDEYDTSHAIVRDPRTAALCRKYNIEFIDKSEQPAQ